MGVFPMGFCPDTEICKSRARMGTSYSLVHYTMYRHFCYGMYQLATPLQTERWTGTPSDR